MITTIRRAHVPATTRTPHVLATRTGMQLFGQILAAMQLWKPLTPKQRTALRLAYRHGIAAAVAAGCRDGDEIEAPRLPAGTHPATARALERRGLAIDGQLTPLAIDVVRFASDTGRDRRPTRTVATVGGLL